MINLQVILMLCVSKKCFSELALKLICEKWGFLRTCVGKAFSFVSQIEVFLISNFEFKELLQKSFDCALWLLPCWNPLETNLSKVKLKRKEVSFSFVQCLLQSCFQSELKEFWSVNELSYLFYPVNIRAFVWRCRFAEVG